VLTTEELKWDDQGRLLTHSPDTLQDPAVGDNAAVFNFAAEDAGKRVWVWDQAVGERLMLAISVSRGPISDAVRRFGVGKGELEFGLSATSESIFMAARRQMRGVSGRTSHRQRIPSINRISDSKLRAPMECANRGGAQFESISVLE